MPMGINQQNHIMRATLDVWEDKIFLNEKEYPAGHFAAEILNISPEFISTTANRAIDLMALLADVRDAYDEKMRKSFLSYNRS